ncbi:copper amine oxidase N-terminal domain-containing protein [Sedimentibacter sp.]|uniref:copper amine oxidase N-terminal domain-containing protein n=1 Tax=Sedimentibacter sp. TaxID=1960295 RepID=UPI0028AADA71|nr:copper amine oxidase N-terminal domain-containing protein [Sedimentibacter sp.]
MKFKKIAATALSVAVLSMSTFAAFADTINESPEVNTDNQVSEENELRSRFMSYTGVIKEISDYHSGDGAKMVAIEDENEFPVNIIITKDTYTINMDKLAVGESLTAFCDAQKPMILIYPPQISAEAAVVGEIDLNVKVDLFNDDLISADNFLKLNVSEETEIVSEDESKFEGELYNRKLVVLYGVSTKSIPAQTNPTKIIVLDEDEPAMIEDVEGMEVVVNRKTLEGIKPVQNDDGVIMVPVRAVSEELGYEVGWNQEEQRVTVGELLSFEIGKDDYTMDDTSGIQLYAAPLLVDGTTYVPLSFFSEFLSASEAHILNSQVIITKSEGL